MMTLFCCCLNEDDVVVDVEGKKKIGGNLRI